MVGQSFVWLRWRADSKLHVSADYQRLRMSTQPALVLERCLIQVCHACVESYWWIWRNWWSISMSAAQVGGTATNLLSSTTSGSAVGRPGDGIYVPAGCSYVVNYFGQCGGNASACNPASGVCADAQYSGACCPQGFSCQWVPVVWLHKIHFSQPDSSPGKQLMAETVMNHRQAVP